MPKRLRYDLRETLNEDEKVTEILSSFQDDNFMACVNFNKLKLPSIISNLNRNHYPKHFKLFPSSDANFFEEKEVTAIKNELDKLLMRIRKARTSIEVTTSEEEYFFKDQLLNIVNIKCALGHKFIRVKQKDKNPGDFYVYFFQQDEQQIRNGIKALQNYMLPQELLFSMDSYLQKNQTYNFQKMVLQFFVKRYGSKIKQLANNQDLKIRKIQPQFTQRIRKNDPDAPPMHSLCLHIEGNRDNLFTLHGIIENFVNEISMSIIQISEPLHKLNEEQTKLLKNQNITELDRNSYLLIGNQLNKHNIIKILQSRQWSMCMDPDEIKILLIQHRQKRLHNYLHSKQIEWDEIRFEQNKIIFKANRINWDLFHKQVPNFLQLFQIVKGTCQGFQTLLKIKIFRKYYEEKLKEKYSAKFTFANQKLYRSNYQKYTEPLEESLRDISEDITKNMVKIYINQNLKPMLINQKNLTDSYEQKNVQNISVGAPTYIMRNVIIKIRPFNSLNKQKKRINYLLDDQLNANSYFHQIYKANSVDYLSFMSKAHAAKKPERLRMYLTPYCIHSKQMVLFHLGGRRKSQTYQRDLDNLLTDSDNIITIALMQHDRQFLGDNFPLLLQKVGEHAQINYQGETFELQIFYEGNKQYVSYFERILKNSKKGIQPLLGLFFSEQDIQLILLNKFIRIQFQRQDCQIGPLQSYIIHYELSRKVKKPRIMVSNPNRNSQFNIQCLVNLKMKKVLIAKPDQESFYSVKEYPLDNFQQIRDYCKTVTYYLKEIEYLVYCLKIQNDKTEVCDSFYLADSQVMKPLRIDLEAKKIHMVQKDQIRYRFHENQSKQIYQIKTYNKELKNLYQCLDL